MAYIREDESSVVAGGTLWGNTFGIGRRMFTCPYIFRPYGWVMYETKVEKEETSGWCHLPVKSPLPYPWPNKSWSGISSCNDWRRW